MAECMAYVAGSHLQHGIITKVNAEVNVNVRIST